MARKKKDEELREAKVVDVPEDDEAAVTDDSMLLPNPNENDTQEEEVQERQELSEDQALFTGDQGLIQALFDWLEAEAKDTDSIKAAHAIAKEYKVPVETALIALDVCRKTFEMKKVTLQNIYDTVNNDTD